MFSHDNFKYCEIIFRQLVGSIPVQGSSTTILLGPTHLALVIFGRPVKESSRRVAQYPFSGSHRELVTNI